MSEEKIVEMKDVGFHGECCIVRAEKLGITELPKDAVKVERDEQGRLMVAHSESGHHHYISDQSATLYKTSNPLISFLQVEMDAHSLLRHAKPLNDPQRHQTQKIPAGLYRISIQRESDSLSGWRKIAD